MNDNGHKSIINQIELAYSPMSNYAFNILKNDIELILLDKLISGVDGTDVCAELKQDEEVAHVPVLMMSALHNVGDICKAAGAVDFIAKPFDMETLTQKIDAILQHQK